MTYGTVTRRGASVNLNDPLVVSSNPIPTPIMILDLQAQHQCSRASLTVSVALGFPPILNHHPDKPVESGVNDLKSDLGGVIKLT